MVKQFAVVALLASCCGAQAQSHMYFWKDSVAGAPLNPVLRELALKPVTRIENDPGGFVLEFHNKYAMWNKNGNRVEVWGYCASACTLVLALPAERLCFRPGAELRFHMPRFSNGLPAPDTGAWMVRQYPDPVRTWIELRGGAAALPLSGFWVLGTDMLYKMGFAKCPSLPTVRTAGE